MRTRSDEITLSIRIDEDGDADSIAGRGSSSLALRPREQHGTEQHSTAPTSTCSALPTAKRMMTAAHPNDAHAPPLPPLTPALISSAMGLLRRGPTPKAASHRSSSIPRPHSSPTQFNNTHPVETSPEDINIVKVFMAAGYYEKCVLLVVFFRVIRMHIEVSLKRFPRVEKVGRIIMRARIIAYSQLLKVCQAEYFRQLLKPVT
ncbi:hypothetical protein ZIOFF_031762 [Zingiber officinale]|uniref:Uncharacterized protein n=1 Tax=Zingiber officinale TaxID=94328 RepID=A0A8J5GUA5_ZINOF|nr:hypothetical protein ZIOFF_031762 [Zingiber officinale]